MDWANAAWFAAGLGLLVGGAELLVRGASKLAALVGVSPLVIGLTVVAWGTGSPELAISVRDAASPDSGGLALGNVVGSNIANILLILGAATLAAPLTSPRQLARVDLPVMIGASALVVLLSIDGRLSRIDGLAFVALLAVYTFISVRNSRLESRRIKAEYAEEFDSPPPRNRFRAAAADVGMVVVGLALLVLGADWLVDAARTMAAALGVSEFVVGLTIVAVGTSLPEAATSVMASMRGHRDIAVGNAVGSNTFNILGVLGCSALAAPHGIAVSSDALTVDLPVMLAVAVVCVPVFLSGKVVSRLEGGLFLLYYTAYIVDLAMKDQAHPQHALFRGFVLWGVLPVSIALLGWLGARHVRAERTARLQAIAEANKG